MYNIDNSILWISATIASLLVTSLLNYVHGSSSIVVTNLARSNPNAIATQSSTCNHGRAHLAIDGNTSGVWNEGSVSTTCANQDDPWWMVEMPNNNAYETNVIASVVVYNHGVQHMVDCHVQVLDGDMNILASQPVNDSYGWRVQTFNFHNVEDGRYVRVQKNGNGFINLGEVEVLGWTKSLESTSLRRG